MAEDKKALPKLNKAVLDGSGNAIKVDVVTPSLQVALADKQNKLLEEMLVVLTNISDNIYNLAGKANAQLTSLKETREVIQETFKVDEGKAAEDKQEAKVKKQVEQKPKNPFEKLLSFFETIFNVLIPYLVGLVLGIKKEFALVAALLLVFRKQVFAIIKELPKAISFLAGAIKTIIQGIAKAGQTLVTGLSKAFYTIYSSVLKTVDFVRKMGPAIAESAGKFRSNFPKVVEGFQKVISKVSSSFNGLINVLKNNSLVGAARELIDDAVKMFAKAKNFILDAPGKLLKAATNAYRSILVINANMIQRVVDFFAKVRSFFSGPGKLLETVVTKVSQTFFKFYSAMLKVGDVFKRVKDALSPITKLFAGPADDVAKAAANVGKQTSLVARMFSAVSGAFSKVGELGKYGKMLTDAFSKGTQVFSKLGSFLKFLGPIGVAISAVTSLFKGVKQAFAGFDEEGIFGAIKGFTSGIISGFFGWIGDLGTWVIGKLLKLLGFEELGDKIASLDFTEMLNQLIANLFDNVKNAFTNMISSLTGGFQKIFSGDDIIGGIVDVMTAIPKMLIDLITSPFKALGDALKDVFDFDIANLAKKLLVSMFPPDSMIGKIIGTGKMQEEVAAAETKKAEEKAKENAGKAEQQAKSSTSPQQVKPAGQQPAPGQATQVSRPTAQTQTVRTTAAPTQTAQRPATVTGQVTTTTPGAAPQTVATRPAATAQQAPVVTPVRTAQQPAAAQPTGAQVQAPSVPPRGAAIAAESQRVAGAQQTSGGGTRNSVIAPSATTNVNNSSSQNVNIKPSAVPTFGIQASVSGNGF